MNVHQLFNLGWIGLRVMSKIVDLIKMQSPKISDPKITCSRPNDSRFFLQLYALYVVRGSARLTLYSYHDHSIANTSATWCLIIMQFTGCQQPVKRSHSPENAIDWVG